MLVGAAGSPPDAEAPVVLMSGTASIDSRGRSTHPGDRSGQILETYRATGSMLDQAGCSFSDVVQAVRYHSDHATWDAHQDLSAQGLLPDLPAIDVLGTICRDDLLFELEVTAAARGAGPRPIR